MADIDPATRAPRGYAVIRKSPSPKYGRLTLFQARQYQLCHQVLSGAVYICHETN